jgi:hypothetical protein
MRPILVGHAVDLATVPLPPTTTAESKPTPPLAQRGLGSLIPRFRRAGRGHGGRARRPRPSQPRGCLPHRRPPRPHLGRTQRTRECTDTGRPQRTPDTRTLRRPHRTMDTGRVDRHAWRLDVRTGHWPLAAGRGCGHADEKHGRRPHLPRPPRSTAAHWTTQRCSCGQRLRRLATLTARRWGHLPARDCLLPCRVAARSLRRLSRASAHCCPRMISGRA